MIDNVEAMTVGRLMAILRGHPENTCVKVRDEQGDLAHVTYILTYVKAAGHCDLVIECD